jgi:putative colanic acid biosynthesis acetyltransferase WcaF
VRTFASYWHTIDPSPPIFQRLDRFERAPYSVGERLKRALWSGINATIWRIPRAWALRRALLRMFGAKVGRRVVFRASVKVVHPWLLDVGDWVTVGEGVTVYNLGPVRVGSHTAISQQTYLCAGTHDYRISHLPLVRPPITIGSGVWIAAQCFIGPGVTIHDNAMVGARAVVSTDLPPGMVAAGNPARVVKRRIMKPEANRA